jgi:hypothetical protein
MTGKEELARTQSYAVTQACDFTAACQDIDKMQPSEREKLCRQIDDYFNSMLSDPARRLFNRQNVHRSAPWILALDVTILGLTPYLGARLFLSPTVQNRLLQWDDEPRGAELFAELGKRLSLHAKKNQGRGKLPVEPWHYEFKEEIVTELTALQRWLRTRTSGTNPGLKLEELKREIAKQVTRADSAFPLLRSSWTSFEKTMELEMEQNTLFRFSMGDATPTQIAEIWIAKALGNRDPESTRQAVSKVGRTVRTSKFRL